MKSTSSAPADIVLPSAVPLWQVSPHSLEWEPVSNLHLSAAELRELQLDPAKPVTATSIPVSVGMAYSTNRPSKPLTRKELCDNRSAGSKQSLSLRNEASAAHVGCRTFSPSRYLSSLMDTECHRIYHTSPPPYSHSIHPRHADPSLPFFPRKIQQVNMRDHSATLALKNYEQRRGAFTSPALGCDLDLQPNSFEETVWWNSCARQPTAKLCGYGKRRGDKTHRTGDRESGMKRSL
eukprot:GHVQ01041335.1.p1 GENE.GHVQ01041335.1~~GHVQ01041335.1.p1  ORF type:complete len:236 (+),score=33.48 GHVQ01041335.1:378-1085(+)